MKSDDYFIKKRTRFVCDTENSYFNHEDYPLPKVPSRKNNILYNKNKDE